MIVVSSLGALAQSSEQALSEKAIALFEQENYEEALPLYSQLLSLNLQSAEYNFRFGACQLFVNSNKEEALKYLSFAAKGENAPGLAYYYYGLGLHYNYRFDRAIDQYQKYQGLAGKKEREAGLVAHNIEQCVSGKNLVSRFTDINVVQKEVLPRSDFFRNYDLREFGGKIIVKPDEFMSEEDKKRDARFIMYFQQNSDVIYYASYSDKNATGKDLYSINRLPTGDWGKPKRLSEIINTEFDEDYPFIHPEGKSLYFASKGHNSMGGYDIFKSELTPQGTFTQPINQEFAINTPWDEFMFITDKAERLAWFASNRETDSKSVTVYKISIDRIPLDLTLIKGTFITETNSKKAKITVEDMVQNKTVGVYDSERQLGEYLLDIRGSGQYKFIIEAEESDVVHTGIVEIPRQKGLKQFKQEMKLVNVNGSEQLQIINHFDQPLEDGESLLTAEILKKQASLNVNADEASFARTTEILDDGSRPKEEVDAMDRFGFATEELEQTREEINTLDDRAAYLYQQATEKANSDDADEVAEASLAAEIALEYKKAADEKRASLERMEAAFEDLKQASGDPAAETAKFNQFQSVAENQSDLAEIEAAIKAQSEERYAPLEESYTQKQEEVDNLEDDVQGIDEEIAYYEQEIEGTKDDALKEELAYQIEQAREARPAKEEALRRARADLDRLQNNQVRGGVLLSTWTNLLTDASRNAAGEEAAVKVSSISVLSESLRQKAQSNPPLLAMIDPETAAKQTEEPEGGSEVEEVVEAEATPETTDINQEIQEISTESSVERIEGDYNDYFLEQLSAAADSPDPLNAETRKAELYDQWADNILLRVDSLDQAIESTTDPAFKTSLIDDRDRLKGEAETKQELALESYQAIALMTDQEAEMASQTNPEQAIEEQPIAPESNPVVAAEEESSEEQPAEEASANTSIANSATPEITERFTAALEEASSIEDETERKQREAEINRQWAGELQTELEKIALDLEETTDEEEEIALKSRANKIQIEKQDRQAIAAQLSREVNQSETSGLAEASDEELERQLFPLIENYDRTTFEQIESQIAQTGDPETRDIKTLTLSRNWLLAIQNEEVKTQARLANTSDPATRTNLEQSLTTLASDKLEVRQKMAALNGENAGGGDIAAPSEVQIQGSERFEGYIPVEASGLKETEERVMTLTERETTLESDIAALEKTIGETKKKKDRESAELKLEMKQNELAIVQTQSAFYQEAAAKLENLEGDLIQLEAGQPLPSERQREEVQQLDQEAGLALEEANEQRSGAEAIKNKKERAAALRDVESYEQRAAQKSLQAELATELATQMETIEQEAIQQNFLVLPGRETKLPVVKRTLNPTEQQDVESTPEYREYAAAIGESEDLSKRAIAMEEQELRLRNEAQASLAQAATNADPEQRQALTDQAYKSFEEADGLSIESARLTRRSAYVRDEANRELLQRPEEVYLNVLAAIQGRTSPEVSIDPPVADINDPGTQEETDDSAQEATVEEVAETVDPIETPVVTEDQNPSTIPTDPVIEPTPEVIPTTEAEDFALTPPAEPSGSSSAVESDVLTNTIFEIDRNTASAPSQEPIPMNPRLPKGVVYKIQVGAFQNEIPAETFGNMKPLVGESAGNGLTRYTVGLFKDFGDAEDGLEQVKSLGYRDAFIVSYYNSSRVPVTEAQAVERNEVSTPPSYVPGSGNATAASSAPSRPTSTNLVLQGPLEIEDVNNNPNLFYAVQVGVFGRPVSSAEVKNITPLNQENMPNGNYRYSTGKFSSFEDAAQARDEVRFLGITDAFVVAYRNGQRLTGSQIPRSGGTQASNTPAPAPTTNPAPVEQPPVARILLGTFQGEIPVSQASVILSLSGEGVDKEKNDDGSNSYYYGAFSTQQEAQTKAAELQQKGLTQAAVVPVP